MMLTATSLPDFMMTNESVYSSYRVYVVFTKSTIPVWAPLLRLALRYYQKRRARYTHCLLLVQDLMNQMFYWYEMDYYEGMVVYKSYVDSVRYDGGKLIVGNTMFYGGTVEKVYDAIDVTTMVNPNEIEDRWQRFYTDIRLTPWTLLRHLTPAKDRVTWTCSGIVQALLTNKPFSSYISPKTPDQLYTTLTQQQQ